MNKKRKGEKRVAGEDNLNEAQRDGVYRYSKHMGSTRRVGIVRQNVQRVRPEMYLEAGLECHSKELAIQNY